MDKKVSTNIISIIISLLIIGVIAFFVYKYFIKIGDVNYKSNNESINLSNTELEKLGKEKFQILYSKHNYSNNEFIFFKDTTVNTSNVDNQDVLSSLYSFLSNEDKNITGSYSEECFLNKGVYTKDNYPDSCSKERFDKSILEEQYYNNFDSNLKVNYTDFYSSSSQKCFITGTTYNCYLNTVNLTIPDYVTISDFDSAKINGNKIEVYSYLLTIRKRNSEDYEAGIYSNASATNKIDDLSYFNGEVGDSISTKMIEELINNYKNRITKYKSIFIKSNNNYVWQSTEIVQ